MCMKKFNAEKIFFDRVLICTLWGYTVSLACSQFLVYIYYSTLSALIKASRLLKTYLCTVLYEPRREKTCFFAYVKTKVQISCTVTAQLISIFVFATQISIPVIFLHFNFKISSL